ncbi:MAG: MFS transporter [Propionibacteriaceae bacterium]|nr:MFS transporter [Propionibacteriaceae bacterium]
MPRNVWVLSSISLAVAVGYGVVSPVLPMFATAFGANEMLAGAVISAFALMRFVFAPAVGRLDDRFGHSRVLMAGILIVAVSSVFTGFARNYAELIVMRGLGGIGSAMFSIAAMTVLLASVDASHRGRASGLYQGGFLVGAMAGPAIGGVLAGISMRAPFFFYAGTLFIAAIAALFLRPVAIAEEQKDRRPLGTILHDRRFLTACLASLSNGWNSNGTRSTLVPLFVAAFLAQSPAQAAVMTGVAMAVAAVVQTALLMPSGWVVDGFGRRVPMVAGALVLAVALAAIPYSPGMVTLTAVLCLYAAGSAIIGTAPAALVGDAAGPDADRPIAVYSMTGDLGSIVGPLVAGFLAGHLGYPSAFALGAILWLATAAMATAMKPKVRR